MLLLSFKLGLYRMIHKHVNFSHQYFKEIKDGNFGYYFPNTKIDFPKISYFNLSKDLDPF